MGCHGGLGGWQTRAILVHPSEMGIDPELLGKSGRLIGAEAVHHQMVQWLEQLGHRTNLESTNLPPTGEIAPGTDGLADANQDQYAATPTVGRQESGSR